MNSQVTKPLYQISNLLLNSYSYTPINSTVDLDTSNHLIVQPEGVLYRYGFEVWNYRLHFHGLTSYEQLNSFGAKRQKKMDPGFDSQG